MILAVIAFGGLVWAATGLWSTLSHYPAWHGAGSALTIVPWIMLGSVIAVVLAIAGPRLKPFFGVFERLFYLSSITWMLIVAIDLARISG
jgi:ABC-type multidrug transport system permease subunit